MTETEQTIPTESLIIACILDRAGSGKIVGWDEVNNWQPEQGLLWLHLNYANPMVQDWIINKSGVSEIVAASLLAEATLPHVLSYNDGIFIALRGVNLNPGEELHDMVSIRIWLQENRIITTRNRRILTDEQIMEITQRHHGPKSAGEFLVDLTEILVSRIAKVIDDVDDKVDLLEELMMQNDSQKMRTELTILRLKIIELRRYLSPQRETMTRLYVERHPLLSEYDRQHLHEISERVSRYVKDLDADRERASITHDEVISRMSEKMGYRMYILSLVAVIFMPLTFVTGLFGMNVGGIPFQSVTWGFGFIVGALFVYSIVQWFYFKRKKWM